jgi:hypothetical protein
MNFVLHVIFMVLAIVGFVLAGVYLCVDYMFTEKKAKTIAQSAFITREEEEEGLGGGRSMINSRQGSDVPLRVQGS